MPSIADCGGHDPSIGQALENGHEEDARRDFGASAAALTVSALAGAKANAIGQIGREISDCFRMRYDAAADGSARSNARGENSPG